MSAAPSTPPTPGTSSTTTSARPIPPRNRSRSGQGGDPDDELETWRELHDWQWIGRGDDSWCE
jgi:hypothetical protein